MQDVALMGVMGAQMGGFFAAVSAFPLAVMWDNMSVIRHMMMG